MTAAALHINGDDWAFVLAREVEASFAIELPKASLARVATVGELSDLILQQSPNQGGEQDEMAVALDILRRAMAPYGVLPDADPGLQFDVLGLPRLRAMRRTLQQLTGLALPGLPLSWVGSAGMVVASLLPFLAWRLGHGWAGVPCILLGLALAKADPGSWTGEWKTLGGLARATAALNHVVLASRGARNSPAVVWNMLTTLLSSWTRVSAAEIGRDTRLLG